MSVRSNIRLALLSLAETQTTFGKRVYFRRVPKTGKYPCIVFQVVSTRAVHDLQGEAGLYRRVVEISVYSNDADALDRIELQLQALEGTLAAFGLIWAFQDDSRDDLETPSANDEQGQDKTVFTMIVWSNT